MRVRGSALSLVLYLALATIIRGSEPDTTAEDERVLREAHVATDSASLLQFFRERTLDQNGQARLTQLAQQLGDKSYKVRSHASETLIDLGAVAIPFLREAEKNPDLEVSRRAADCLRQIEERYTRVGVAASAARLLALRKPAGAAQALLGYLPFAESDAVAEEIKEELEKVALRNGKPDKAVFDALTDTSPVRRGAAAEVLCRMGDATARAAVRKLLTDSDPVARFRAALGLAIARDKEGIPVIIELLDQLPQGQTWLAQDALVRLAGEQAPKVTLERDEATRHKARMAWAAWWHDNAAKADLGRLAGFAGGSLGYTLLVMLDAGRVIELDERNHVRWQVDGLEFPLDAQALPHDHLLAAEYNGNRVIERSRDGRIVWEKAVEKPLAAQRLPNGLTFIATQTKLFEVDRAGKEVADYPPPPDQLIMKAQKLPNGDIACVTSLRRFVRLSPAGKELVNFPVAVRTSGGRIDVLPNGRVLVPEMEQNRVAEYDTEGKVIWQVSFPQPVAAVRLSNGHTLVTSMRQFRAVELDRLGKEVWEYKAETRVTRAFRR
jgi:HEAT repeat protein